MIQFDRVYKGCPVCKAGHAHYLIVYKTNINYGCSWHIGTGTPIKMIFLNKRNYDS